MPTWLADLVPHEELGLSIGNDTSDLEITVRYMSGIARHEPAVYNWGVDLEAGNELLGILTKAVLNTQRPPGSQS